MADARLLLKLLKINENKTLSLNLDICVNMCGSISIILNLHVIPSPIHSADKQTSYYCATTDLLSQHGEHQVNLAKQRPTSLCDPTIQSTIDLAQHASSLLYFPIYPRTVFLLFFLPLVPEVHIACLPLRVCTYMLWPFCNR